MIQCSGNCPPSCDFCIYAVHQMIEVPDAGYDRGEVIACKKHPEVKKDICCSHFCDDFHCYKTKKDLISVISYQIASKSKSQ